MVDTRTGINIDSKGRKELQDVKELQMRKPKTINSVTIGKITLLLLKKSSTRKVNHFRLTWICAHDEALRTHSTNMAINLKLI